MSRRSNSNDETQPIRIVTEPARPLINWTVICAIAVMLVTVAAFVISQADKVYASKVDLANIQANQLAAAEQRKEMVDRLNAFETAYNQRMDRIEATQNEIVKLLTNKHSKP